MANFAGLFCGLLVFWIVGVCGLCLVCGLVVCFVFYYRCCCGGFDCLLIVLFILFLLFVVV